MLTLNIGPLALAMPHVVIMVALVVAMTVGWWVGRRSGTNPESTLFNLLIVALVVARLAFVVTYFESYRSDLLGVIDIRDGGFIAWPGVVAALLLGIWKLWKMAALRKPLGIALATGVIVWAGGNAVLQSLEQGTRLPELTLVDLNAEPAPLQRYVGKPMVVNLWATWCPPCRREMPVLETAQQAHPEVAFVFVNQGESSEEVNRFLNTQGLTLANVLLDTNARFAKQVGSMALPTTLFYDAQGRQIASHLGELSHASLSHALNQLEETLK